MSLVTTLAPPPVGLLLVMHGKLGRCLLDTLIDTMGPLPMVADVLEIRRVQAHEVLIRQGQLMLDNINQGSGVLVLTDAYGSTPSNIANKLVATRSSSVAVSGTNLPMLMRVYNYASQPLEKLAALAVEGGQRGVMLCPRS